MSSQNPPAWPDLICLCNSNVISISSKTIRIYCTKLPFETSFSPTYPCIMSCISCFCCFVPPPYDRHHLAGPRYSTAEMGGQLHAVGGFSVLQPPRLVPMRWEGLVLRVSRFSSLVGDKAARLMFVNSLREKIQRL